MIETTSTEKSNDKEKAGKIKDKGKSDTKKASDNDAKVSAPSSVRSKARASTY